MSKDYRDPKLTADARAAALLDEMTLDEKIAQLGSAWMYELLENNALAPGKAAQHMAQGLGQVTRLAGSTSLTPNEAAAAANAVQRWLLENTRLRIPAMIHEECCSGYMARGATCFPQSIGVASTWEPELAEQLAAVVRTQMRAAGAHQGLSPVIDVTRDARWGRVEETYGEDPYLTASMGVAFVRGIQGESWETGVLATAKHFVGYGMSEGGMNWAPPHINPRELREVYLHPFEAVVKEANLASIMNASHELDGVPCGSSRWLLTELLREQWGFEGIVVSDYFAIDQLHAYHQVAAGKAEAAALALNAGLDVELPFTDCYAGPLKAALEEGRVRMAELDESVRRVLEWKFRLGLFENPYVDEGRAAEVFDTAEQRALARRIAERSIVLLKNEGVLPLAETARTLAVIGPNADTVRNIIGDYAYPCHVESLEEMRRKNDFGSPVPDSVTFVENAVPMQTLLQGIRDRAGEGVEVLYAQGCEVNDEDRSGFAEAEEAARRADVAVVIVGDRAGLTDWCTSGETRDRAELRLPGVQEELVRAVHATGTPVVAVLVNGRPAAIPWLAENVAAIVEAWLPAEEGAAALAAVLFGDANPGGKLPMSVPRGVGQVPVYYGHKLSGGRSHWKGDYVDMSAKPLYPFGYGLSYTSFAFENLEIGPAQVAMGGEVTVALDVVNTGERAGSEVVQLYIRDPHASVTRPVKELKGFARVDLAPGERKRVAIALRVNQLAFYDRRMRLVVEPGEIEVMAGASSEDIRLRGSFTVTGDKAEVEKAFFSRVTVG